MRSSHLRKGFLLLLVMQLWILWTSTHSRLLTEERFANKNDDDDDRRYEQEEEDDENERSPLHPNFRRERNQELDARRGKRRQRRGGRLLNSKLLKDNKASPFLPEESATMCATRTPDGTCRIQPCPTHHNIKQEHEPFGFVTRPDPLRGTVMQSTHALRSSRGCAVSQTYKFIYIHVLKSGGMTFKGFLKNALCGTHVMPCPRGDENLRIVNCAMALRAYPHYFVWSFVRNPFSRFFSGYAMAQQAKYRNFTFSEFAGANAPETRRLTRTTVAHFEPQATYVLTHDGCPVFDFIGRLERLREDIQILLRRIQSPELTAFVEARNGTLGHATDTDYGKDLKESRLGGNLRNAYKDRAVVQAVATKYAVDFDLLRYDNTIVPTN